jgi:cation diffusion facilitator family transporter
MELTPQHRESLIRKNIWVGMILSAFLVVFKVAIGIAYNSRAVIMDGFHSLSDFSTDIIILFGARYWSQPPDAEHPYGHRRIETIVTLIIGGILLLAGVWMGISAIHALVIQHETATPGWPAFWVAVISVVSKEWLYQWTKRVGRKTHSLALQANAWHHRSDALSSIPVAIVVFAARFWPQLAFLDSVGAAIVAAFLLQAAYKIVRPAFNEILEFGAPRQMMADIVQLAKDVPGVMNVHGIRSRYAGANLFIDLHVMVNPKLTVEEGHAITSKVCDVIHANTQNVIEVLVHLEAYKRDRHKSQF